MVKLPPMTETKSRNLFLPSIQGHTKSLLLGCVNLSPLRDRITQPKTILFAELCVVSGLEECKWKIVTRKMLLLWFGAQLEGLHVPQQRIHYVLWIHSLLLISSFLLSECLPFEGPDSKKGLSWMRRLQVQIVLSDQGEETKFYTGTLSMSL